MNVYNRGLMKNLSYKIIPILSLLLLVTSCGQDGDSSSSGNVGGNEAEAQEERPSETVPVDGSNIDGTYTARLVTLNSQVNGTIPGSATFMRKDDKWMAYVRLFAGMPKAWHMQHVYVGNRCPTPNDDLARSIVSHKDVRPSTNFYRTAGILNIHHPFDNFSFMHDMHERGDMPPPFEIVSAYVCAGKKDDHLI